MNRSMNLYTAKLNRKQWLGHLERIDNKIILKRIAWKDRSAREKQKGQEGYGEER